MRLPKLQCSNRAAPAPRRAIVNLTLQCGPLAALQGEFLLGSLQHAFGSSKPFLHFFKRLSHRFSLSVRSIGGGLCRKNHGLGLAASDNQPFVGQRLRTLPQPGNHFAGDIA